MINIKLDERCVFTFSAEDLSIGIWKHSDGWLKGLIEGYIGDIQFSNQSQFEMFHEMMTMAIEKIKDRESKM